VLLQRQGDAHEAAHLGRLKAAGRDVVEIVPGNLATDAETTSAALVAAPEVGFQGVFLSGNWGGWSDFLERVERPSAMGSFNYKVVDTKLKRRPHPKHVLQLVLYSDLLTEIQGVAPEFAHVELGDGTRATLRLSEYTAYARTARARLEGFVADRPPTRPMPCADCGLCRWGDHCEVWRAEDSLFNVANISRGQVKKLEAAGIKTMEALASLDHSIRGMAENTRVRLATQARLQCARKTGMPAFELRAPEPGKEFDLLPEPQSGDIFYDIEGDPYYDGGLEYLHGVWFDGKFRAFWAHDHVAEARALTDLLELFRTRLNAQPDARIYHYAAYEITALRRLTTKYGIGEAFLDWAMRERRFVDLFAVVRGGLIGSEANSIKSMEAFYGSKRDGEVKTAGGSVVAYERWRETGDQQILDEIEDYNRVDCISTEELRDWLVGIRPAAPWPSLGQETGIEEDADAQALRSGRASRNIVLVGDPRQLPQVIQGAHPPPANLSCLDWMLGDHATVPPDRGIFLPVSRRMHPDVCRFISNRVYEGRLTSHPDTARQAVTGTSFPDGAFWVPVPHEGNAQIAPEEVAAIQGAVRNLLTGSWTEKDGTTRPMRQSDIIVVAPYNAQVNALIDALPQGTRVGTVDRFQGQEAPVCLVSMTTSLIEETPRGMDFLFSLNRMNVAVSRAKGLALLFGAPSLREAKCETVDQMRLVNLVCALNTC
jgi:predicted RecB family nuclease